MPKGRTRTQSNTTGSSTTTSTATGTPFAEGVLSAAAGNNVIGDVFAANDGGFQGPREASIPIRDSMFANWGPTPTTFVPQLTTGASPQAQQQQTVNVNDTAGIQAGINNANAQAGQLADISNAGLAGVQTAIGSPYQGLDEMLTALRNQYNITSAQSTQNLAEVAGSQGAFGGTSFARDNAMQSGELQRAFDDQAAQLLWADQARRDQWLRDGAGVAGQFAGVGDLTAQRLLNYGGLDLQNQQNAADIAYQNAQADAQNAFTAGQLVDTNAERAAQDAIAQWEAIFQSDQQAAQNDLLRGGLEQANAQTDMNNAYYNWAGGQESLDQLLQRLGVLNNIAAAAPGGTTSGTMQQQSTTTQQQSQSALATLGSLLGAGMQFFGGGGFGSLTGPGAVPSVSGGGAGSLLSILASERRLKTNIVPLFESKMGVPWYSFEYKDNPGVVHTGVMEDEVRYIPNAVVRIDGVNHVNYDVIAQWEAA